MAIRWCANKGSLSSYVENYMVILCEAFIYLIIERQTTIPWL